ncbi:CCA tRNA nucleotidyltransferase [Pseudohoeflea coraliihabitans]|uniref:CCA tRNA nucleotidyltransferase n=1 Tax=Pseudohoeflea coraliihabitans TaxID=2860393 RepID=A0ABS6WKE1_9HYPH|nr:CCA tRNA nucleotidyltransferase [Pseudohoeflea sp. DP4N28-3]MBW3096123.1 CCA tRNA nucleotidyltransferase [Pseudohoeflea sp. DP4N28-3]
MSGADSGPTGRSVAGESWFESERLRSIFRLLNTDGGEGRVVGGAVRNTLLGAPVADIDMATTLLPDEVMRRAGAAGIKALPTGIEHGTVTLVIEGQPFEVTSLRTDVKPSGRHAEVAFGADWAADAARRDFTINALYADSAGRIFDPTGGLADIKTRTIRFIGDAEQRIVEDHLRILRFFRFFAWYGGGRPDAGGLKACVRQRDTLGKLSAERVWKELKVLLSAPSPGRALLWMRQSGILTALLPETEKWGIDAIAGLVELEEALALDIDPMIRLMAMLPPDAERLAKLAVRLKLSKAEAARLVAWANAPAADAALAGTALDRQLYLHGAAAVIDRLTVALATLKARPEEPNAAAMAAFGHLKGQLQRARAWKRPQFPVSGKDLLAVGMAPGETIGARLKAGEARWIDSNFSLDRDSLLKTMLDMP